MLNKEQKALLVHRENYIVPKGQEHVVHYKIAKVRNDGTFIEKPRIVKTNEKMFEVNTKRNLELQGYTIEILWHPRGKYSNVSINDKDAIIASKDETIERLTKELESMKEASKIEEPKEETFVESKEMVEEVAEEEPKEEPKDEIAIEKKEKTKRTSTKGKGKSSNKEVKKEGE